MSRPSRPSRLLAFSALLATAVAVALLARDGAYEVRVVLPDAGQLVEGNRVLASGVPVGTIERTQLTDDGQAELTLALDDRATPLREGTKVVVRAASLSGVANRYVDLQFPSGRPPEIPNGGRLPLTAATSAVDLDQVLNLFGRRQRQALAGTIQGSGLTLRGVTGQARAGWRYLDPALLATSRYADALAADPQRLDGVVVAASALVEQVADHDEQVTASVSGLDRTFAALAQERRALTGSLSRLPAFLTQASSTLGSLRETLPDVDGLVDAGTEALPALRPWTGELRQTFRALRPASRSLSELLRRPGRSNDLVDALRTLPALERTAVGDSGAGSLPAGRRALDGTLPALRFARPYTPDIVAWIADFAGESGVTDALGGIARTAPVVNALAGLDNQLTAVPRSLREVIRARGARTGQTDRCPGSLERDPGDGSTPYKPTPSFGCDPTQVPPGR